MFLNRIKCGAQVNSFGACDSYLFFSADTVNIICCMCDKYFGNCTTHTHSEASEQTDIHTITIITAPWFFLLAHCVPRIFFVSADGDDIENVLRTRETAQIDAHTLFYVLFVWFLLRFFFWSSVVIVAVCGGVKLELWMEISFAITDEKKAK